MPEEKVSRVHDKLCPIWDRYPKGACDCDTRAAADAGPRQPDAEYADPRSMGNCMKHGDYGGRNISCPKCAVPQEAAHRIEDLELVECVDAECEPAQHSHLRWKAGTGPKATAPDWAMRVAAKIAEELAPALADMIHQKGVMPIETESIRPRPVNAEGAHRASIETSATVAKIIELAKSDPPRCGHDIYDYTSRAYGCCRPKDHDGPHETLEDRHSNRYGKEIEDKKCAQMAALIREAGSERERRLTSVLFVIMSDMPKKRDWLDPDIEREASRLLGGEANGTKQD